MRHRHHVALAESVKSNKKKHLISSSQRKQAKNRNDKETKNFRGKNLIYKLLFFSRHKFDFLKISKDYSIHSVTGYAVLSPAAAAAANGNPKNAFRAMNKAFSKD
ncbi:CLUMA_CG009027, isoform A [Clunio marinus]|uniref:CLUMA_CG009027, isoform A n=1 Tax=Clunio marinus TaxID=568069 RepID=A0A1J1I5V3_9DIPT|nr:CLUMA_CG009027, isoform A [Clunio marinus]